MAQTMRRMDSASSTTRIVTLGQLSAELATTPPKHSVCNRGAKDMAGLPVLFSRCYNHRSTLGEFCLMAKVCEICGRGPQFGNRISHAHNLTKRRWNVNLQSVRVAVGGGAKKMRVCTSCIRAGK